MKLASLKSTESRDGELCVVNRTLTTAVKVGHIAKTMQMAIDNWASTAAPLKAVYHALNQGKVNNTFPFEASLCSSPLPRAYQWADGSAYLHHVELVRKTRNAAMPPDAATNPLMYQGGSDNFVGPCDPITVTDEAYGIDFEAELAIITDEVPMGIHSDDANQHILLMMLVNDVSLRNLIPAELAKGFGFFQSKPANSFSPVAITVDELGQHWDGKRVHLPMLSHLNGHLFGKPNAGADMAFTFGDLIAHAAKTRVLTPGTIIGSGTVSNVDESRGCSCISEKRMLEYLKDGEMKTSYMHFGDTIRIEMLDEQGQSLFGAINQKVVKG